MLTEQAIAVVVFLILLAIAVAGYIIASREAERLDRQRRPAGEMRDTHNP